MAAPKITISGGRSPVNERDLQNGVFDRLESLPNHFDAERGSGFRYLLSCLALLLLFFANCTSTTGSQPSESCEPNGFGCGLAERCDDDQGCVPLLMCSPESCDGCCLENQCIRPGNSDRACGKGGDPCLNCERAGSTCQSGSCGLRCDASNCSGCCDPDSGRCVIFSQQASQGVCGEGGDICSNCAENTRCRQGECVADLCRNTCEGCCDGERCVTDPREGCGENGDSCQDCDGGACSAGVCVSVECSEQCSDGCCDAAGTCQAGNEDNSCGSQGGSCESCVEGEECISGSCLTGFRSRWKIVIESAEVPLRDSNQDLWDFSGLPDLYIQIQLGAGANALTARTERIMDSLVFDFLSEEIVSDVSMETIMQGFVVTWYDWDLVNFDDAMEAAALVHSPSAFNGELLLFESGQFKLYYRLLPFDVEQDSPNRPSPN